MSLRHRSRIKKALDYLGLNRPEIDPIYDKLIEVFPTAPVIVEPVTAAAQDPEPETAEERFTNDMMMYWNGVDQGPSGMRGNGIAPFPSVMLTEMILRMTPGEKRALAIHLGLEQILEEQREAIQDGVDKTHPTYGMPSIKKVKVGVTKHGAPKRPTRGPVSGITFDERGAAVFEPVDPAGPAVTGLESCKGLVKINPVCRCYPKGSPNYGTGPDCPTHPRVAAGK
jgi:hypothetical protein